MHLPFVLPLSATDASLDLLGGKGASLSRMAAAGLPVPDGFHVTTAAHRRVVASSGLAATIERHVSEAAGDSEATARAAAAIAGSFADAALPEDIAAAIRQAYAELGGGAVAVRSSATAEDLPDLSFAGQQETFLNIHGEEALLAAVRRCWASLWGARALEYRHHMGVDGRALAMSVVVQRMVPAEVAGVLFTANPTTGARDELVVNASFGLGEVVVGGEVVPDTHVLDRESGAPRQTRLGVKAVMIVPTEDQGTTTRAVPESMRGRAALTEPQLRELAALGLRVESLFGHVHQDIEWALVDGALWLLQSRPITNLPPAPLAEVRWEPPVPGSAWIRRQVVEHMPGPVSPLFADLYLGEALEAGGKEMQAAMGVPRRIAEDLIDRPLFTTVHGFAYMRANLRIRWWTIPLMLLAMTAGVAKLVRNAGIRYWRDDGLPTYQREITRWQALDVGSAADAELLEGVRALAFADARYWYACTLAVGTAKVAETMLARFLRLAIRGRGLHSGAFLRGFPSRTLAAQQELAEIAASARRSERLLRLICTTPPRRLLEALERDVEGRPIAKALHEHLVRHGHQIYDLDFAAPTQAEEPLPVLLGLSDLLQRPAEDPAARTAELARVRDELVESTARSLGPIRRRLFRRLVGMAQRFGPSREEALFHVGAAWPLLRRLALALGQRLVDADALAHADDVFYLTQQELAEAARGRSRGGSRGELVRLTQERRTLRAARLRLHPPAAVPPDFGLKLGPFDLSSRESQHRNPDTGSTLRGFPVSPGRVTAPAVVIGSPEDFGTMRPGAILVCPTTTPAWTPLFARAAGLVTDIGGVLAHGSIVAREYGLPAVMGTGNATRRIVTGRRITVDGDAGIVTLHDEEASGGNLDQASDGIDP